jgi:dipeptidyl aminopeptidase/acylaminoacyl peptidase
MQRWFSRSLLPLTVIIGAIAVVGSPFHSRSQTPVWERDSVTLCSPAHGGSGFSAKQSFAEGRSQTGVWQRDYKFAVLPTDVGYTVTNGEILVDDAAPMAPEAAPQSRGSAPGKVDTLDIARAYDRANKLAGQTKGKVFKTSITPHWFQNDTRFWYRNDLIDDTKEFVVVDAEKGSRGPAFDHEKLAASLTAVARGTYEAKRLPFSTIDFIDDGKAIRFDVSEQSWRCDLTSYECTPMEKKKALTVFGLVLANPAASVIQQAPAYPPADQIVELDEFPDDPELSPEELEAVQQKGQKKGGQKQGGQKQNLGPAGASEAKSPDGKWFAFIKDYNLYLRDSDNKETQLSQNGVQGNAYGMLSWSPDSKSVLFYRIEPGAIKQVYLIESSPKDQLPAKLSQRPYARAADKFPLCEMWVLDVDSMKPNKVDAERIDNLENERQLPRVRWSKDRKTFTFEKTDRGHQRFRIIEVEALTGKTRNLLDEKAATMVDHYSFATANIQFREYLDETNEIIYVSEMDGWKHIYLIDAKEGKIKNQVTKGEWVVRKLERIDAKNRQIWFQGSGKNFNQDPYFIHHYRVNFDGTGLTALTEGDGNHAIQYSPDGKYLIDTYSRVDMAPVHELRKVADGTLVCGLDKADVSALESVGWRFPEVFVAKGRDGKTDIWGIVYRPQNFDPAKSYPVIEYIYAGPHSSFTPKTFKASQPMAALAELGFIVVQMDGMGTGNRSRAFHDVCWKNLADAGFPDRILWIKALAKRYSYVDITRVGIYGTSAGGQSSTGAVLFHPEFYKVAVSSCGCHDNRLDKSSWNEAWMGLMGPHYEAQSNVTNAKNLAGHLLLIVGELDTNVPPESTYRVVDALIKAKKDFDLIVVPGANHGNGGPHGDRRRLDFFVRHLLGVEPPDWNALAAAKNGRE